MSDEHQTKHQKIVHYFSTAMMLLFGLVAAAIIVPEVVYKVANAFGYLEGTQGCPDIWGLGNSILWSIGSALASAGFAAGAPASAGNKLLNWVAGKLPGK